MDLFFKNLPEYLLIYSNFIGCCLFYYSDHKEIQ